MKPVELGHDQTLKHQEAIQMTKNEAYYLFYGLLLGVIIGLLIVVFSSEAVNKDLYYEACMEGTMLGYVRYPTTEHEHFFQDILFTICKDNALKRFP